MIQNDEGFTDLERFSLSQAARELGISVPSARRLVFKGKLRGFKVKKGDKDRWEVLKSEVFSLKHSELEQTTSSPEANPDLNEDSSDVKHSVKASHLNDSGSVPLQAHLAALEMVNRLHEQLESERRERELAERSKLALEWQMQQYRQALSEQAESLVESQAMRKVAEAQLEVSQSNHALKVGKPERKSWGQRVKGWFGFKDAG